MSAEKVKAFVSLHKFTLGLVLIVVVLIMGGFFVYQKIAGNNIKAEQEVAEVDLTFDPEGTYALLSPRRDGNALILSLKRTASYDSISYELAYTSKADAISNSAEGGTADGGSIDRGVMGSINMKDKKGEYEQEILFGTCSKNVCKYDTGVENGTLTLHLRKGAQAFRMITQWHLQKPDITLGALSSGDGHFLYKIDPNSTDLTLTKFTIINDLTGAPKLPNDKVVVGKVYGLNSPMVKELPAGEVTIELAENPSSDSKIAVYEESANKWVELNTKVDGSTLKATASGGGVFTVFSPKR